jgi:hypothetical protein
MKRLVASAVLAMTLQVCLCSFGQQQAAASAPQVSAQSEIYDVITPEIVREFEAGGMESGGTFPDAASVAASPSMKEEAMLTPPPAPVGVAAAPEVPTRAKVFDKRFVGLGLAVFGTTAMDMEFTQHCLKANTCVELNPTLPTSHWGMYATNTPVNLGVMWLAHKRRAGGHRDWWIWPALDTGIHVYGITTNARYEFRKR